MLSKLLGLIVSLMLLCNIAYAFQAPALNKEMLEHSVPHYAKVGNGVIEYYDIGHGKPIVMICGYGSNVTSWDWQLVAVLASHNRVIVFDNRGTGGTAINSTSYNSKDLANDTYDLISQLNLDKPAILGISMGGMIAQQYAVLHSDSMSKLILINTAIAGHKFVLPSEAVQQSMASPPSNQLGLYMRAVKLFFPPQWRIHMAFSLLHDRFISVNLKEKPTTKAVLMEQQSLIRTWSQDNATEEQISKLSMPVLILSGGQDIVIPPINSNNLLNSIPHATLLRWTQGGHSMIYQFPYPIASAITNFIAH